MVKVNNCDKKVMTKWSLLKKVIKSTFMLSTSIFIRVDSGYDASHKNIYKNHTSHSFFHEFYFQIRK